MRKISIMLGIAALAAGLSPGASGLEVALKYERAPLNYETSGVFFPYGFGYTQASDLKPSGAWKLPALNAEKPLYALLTFGDRKHLVVVDTKQPGEKTYSRLWFDRDGDGDLTGETPVEGSARQMQGAYSGYISVRFPPIETTIMVSGMAQPYCFQPQISGSVPSITVPRLNVTFAYMAPCAYRGAFTLGGRQYTFWLCDGNGNGRFGDFAGIRNNGLMIPGRNPLAAEGDYLFLTDRAKPEESAVQRTDAQPLGNYLLLGSQVFEVGFDMAKGKMILTEMKTGLGSLKLPSKVDRLTLCSETGGKFLTAFNPPETALMVPAGKYRLISYQATRRDEQGDLWRLGASGTAESPVITVAQDTPASLSLGEPFQPVIELPAGTTSSRSGSTPLRFKVEGQGKELLSDITHLEGTATKIPLSTALGRASLPKEPEYTIVKADGELVARGSFEYG